ncbi:hypothetical protein LTR10_015852 [Elasticomyces elasticus]|nr:hypothetical protein LTR10_015852 [Elasticomyces elasticus]
MLQTPLDQTLPVQQSASQGFAMSAAASSSRIPSKAGKAPVLSAFEHGQFFQEPQGIDDGSADEQAWKEQNLLSFDGGGIRGYWSLLVLQHLMKCIAAHEAGFVHDISGQRDSHIHSFTPQPFRQNACQVLTPKEMRQRDAALTEEDKITVLEPVKRFLPCHYFDYIGGSSTGGLIAMMLGRLRMTVPDCLAEYKNLGGEVFGKPRTFTQLNIPFIKRSKYSSKTLRAVFEDVARRRGEKTESDLGRPTFASGNGMCKCFVTSLMSDLRKGSPSASELFIIRSYPCYKRQSQNQRPPKTTKIDGRRKNTLQSTWSNVEFLQQQDNQDTEPLVLNPTNTVY